MEFTIVSDDEAEPPPPVAKNSDKARDEKQKRREELGGERLRRLDRERKRGELPPKQRDGLLVRADPAKSSLEECIETIGNLEVELRTAEKMDAGLVRELRVWRERRLELEDRVSHEQAGLFFPPGMEMTEIIAELERLLELAKTLLPEEKEDEEGSDGDGDRLPSGS